ncbi:hypothetical protein J6590_078562 [Homalodisca vitripennis]|nr:hypothetical protein J6590_078562 [Homalodisca vitripennis]
MTTRYGVACQSLLMQGVLGENIGQRKKPQLYTAANDNLLLDGLSLIRTQLLLTARYAVACQSLLMQRVGWGESVGQGLKPHPYTAVTDSPLRGGLSVSFNAESGMG